MIIFNFNHEGIFIKNLFMFLTMHIYKDVNIKLTKWKLI